MVPLKAPIKAAPPLASVSRRKFNLITHEAINSCQYKHANSPPPHPPLYFPVGTAEVLRLGLFVRRCARVSALGAANLGQLAGVTRCAKRGTLCSSC